MKGGPSCALWTEPRVHPDRRFNTSTACGRLWRRRLPGHRQRASSSAAERLPLIGAAGIWKPQALSEPISIMTSHRDPYGDELGPDGFLSYRYQGSEARVYYNEGLRRAMNLGLPLVYFEGLGVGS